MEVQLDGKSKVWGIFPFIFLNCVKKSYYLALFIQSLRARALKKLETGVRCSSKAKQHTTSVELYNTTYH